MWGNKYSQINKKIIVDRIGKSPYSKEITNLILCKIDRETTFIHHLLPSAMEYLVTLFGEIRGRDSMFSNLDILKGYYKEGSVFYDEYIKYLDELGVTNITNAGVDEFARKMSDDEEEEAYIRNTIRIYIKYARTDLLNIMALEQKIEDMKKREEEWINTQEYHEKNIVSKVLDYFRKD